MKRLIIHLKKVDKQFIRKGEKTISKVFNTLNIPIVNDREKDHHLNMHEDNIKKYKISYFK